MSHSANPDAAARAALEALAGRAFTDAEWQRGRSRLIEVATILRCWNHHSEERNRGSNKVVTMSAKTSEAILEEAA